MGVNLDETVRLSDGTKVPALGQGTWAMGEQAGGRAAEIAALRLGIELGMTVIDTAEMYADGEAESLVGEAIAGVRDEVFLVSKAYPQNASSDRLPHACEASLRRLRTDRLDLYLLHWRGGVPLAETVEAMERLIDAGKIVRWGVSNLDTADMEELIAAGGTACATNQVLYNLTRRGPEFDLLPWLAEHRIPVMAYSPVEQGRLLRKPQLRELAARIGATPAQLALAWTVRNGNVLAIPKAVSIVHVRENRAAADLMLSDEDLAALDAAFVPPRRRVPLAVGSVASVAAPEPESTSDKIPGGGLLLGFRDQRLVVGEGTGEKQRFRRDRLIELEATSRSRDPRHLSERFEVAPSEDRIRSTLHWRLGGDACAAQGEVVQTHLVRAGNRDQEGVKAHAHPAGLAPADWLVGDR